MRRASVAVALGILALAAASCGARGEPVVTVLNDHDIVGLDPHAVSAVFQTQTVLANMYEPLVSVDAGMALKPALAVSWSNPDDHTWEFALRKDVKFHDGSMLEAADVAWSYERARRVGRSLALAALGNVRAIEVAGPHLVRLRTTEKDATLASRLRDVPIVSRRLVEANGDAVLATRSGGTGAYRFMSRAEGRYVDLERFEEYWDGAAPFRRGRFVARSYGAGDLADALPKPVALVFWDPADPALQKRADDEARRHADLSLAVSYLGFDLRGPTTPGVRLPDGSQRNPFADVRVREAVALAIDIARLHERAYGGRAAPATQMVPAMVLGYDPDLLPPRADPARSRQLLAEAGLPDGFDVELDVRTVMARSASPLVEDLAKAGIRAHVAIRNEEEFFERVRSGRSSAYLLRFSCRSGDAQELLDKWVHSRDDARGYGQSNYSYDVNPIPALDAEIEAARQQLRPDKRLPLLKALMRRVVAARLAIPLINESSITYAAPGLDWRPRADTFFLLKEIAPAED